MAFLRPEFTRTLTKRLSEGSCINLISPHGQGRRRTLEDLCRCLPETMHVLQANLRNSPQSLSAMLAGLAAQAELDGADSLEDLLNILTRRTGRSLLILHNLDELQPGAASGYDDAFFAALSGICNHAGIALLCVSERVPEDWPLQIESILLPPLAPKQLLAELARRNPPAPPEIWPEIAAWLAGQPAPYTLLDQPQAWPDR